MGSWTHGRWIGLLRLEKAVAGSSLGAGDRLRFEQGADWAGELAGKTWIVDRGSRIPDGG